MGRLNHFTDSITKYYSFNSHIYQTRPPTKSRSYYKLGNHNNAVNDNLWGTSIIIFLPKSFIHLPRYRCKEWIVHEWPITITVHSSMKHKMRCLAESSGCSFPYIKLQLIVAVKLLLKSVKNWQKIFPNVFKISFTLLHIQN